MRMKSRDAEGKFPQGVQKKQAFATRLTHHKRMAPHVSDPLEESQRKISAEANNHDQGD
jgi:hypothetical protein